MLKPIPAVFAWYFICLFFISCYCPDKIRKTRRSCNYFHKSSHNLRFTWTFNIMGGHNLETHDNIKYCIFYTCALSGLTASIQGTVKVKSRN